MEKSKNRCHFSYCSDTISKQFSNLEVSQEMEYTIFNKHYKALRLNYGCIQTTNSKTGTIHYFDRRGYKPGPRKLLFPPNTSIATPTSTQLENQTQIASPQMSNENEQHGHVTKNQAGQQIMISNTVSQNKNSNHENRSRDMDNVNNDHESKQNYRQVNDKKNKTDKKNKQNNTNDNNSMPNQVSFETFGSPRSISSSSLSGSSVTHCSDNYNENTNNSNFNSNANTNYKFNINDTTSSTKSNNKIYREFLEEKTSFEASMDSDRYRIIQIDRIDNINVNNVDIHHVNSAYVFHDHDVPEMIMTKTSSVTVSAECYKAALAPLFSEPAIKSPRGDIVLTTNYLQNDGTYQERLYHGGSWASLNKIANNGRLLNNDFEKQNINDKNLYFSRAAKFSHYHTGTNELNQYCLLSCSVLIGKYKKNESCKNRRMLSSGSSGSSGSNSTQSIDSNSLGIGMGMQNMDEKVFEISKEYQCTPRYKIVYVWRPY